MFDLNASFQSAQIGRTILHHAREHSEREKLNVLIIIIFKNKFPNYLFLAHTVCILKGKDVIKTKKVTRFKSFKRLLQ